MNMNKKLIPIALVITGLLLLVVVSFLVYREWSPEDDSAATIYYLSPNGSDSNPGTGASPWKTITKAVASVSSGDTVILKDGVYTGYVGLNKSNITWRAENRNKAIIDGGFSPALLQGDWSRINDIHPTACAGKDIYSNLLTIGSEISNVTVDGIVLRNSCGRGLYLHGNNNTFQNGRIDWTLIAGVYIDDNSVGNKLLNNTITRITFNDQLNFYKGDGYSVNVSMYMRGDDMVIKGNTIAWGRGEMAMPFSNNLLFEDNVVVGMKNNFYIGWTHDTVARNNLFYSPETENTADTHWAYPYGSNADQNKINWRISGRAENKGDQTKGMTGPKNVQFYNNISINNGIGFDGYHRRRNNDGDVLRCSGNIFNGLYFGHNTIITREDTNNAFHMNYSQCNGIEESANSQMIGIFENNIIDNSKNRDAGVNFSLDGNDQLVIRNNIFPVGTQNYGNNNIYTNNPEFNATIEQLKILNLRIPGIGVSMEQVDTQDLRNLVDLNRIRLKQNSPAINAGTTAGSPNSATIPSEVRSRDYLRNSRNGIPDIGAMEYGGVYNTSTPTPIQSATPTPAPSQTPGASLTPTLTRTPGASLTPTLTRTPGPSITPSTTPTPRNSQTPIPSATPTPPIIGNICGKADVDGDGRFSIADFAEFAKSYGTGRNTCADKDVEYGACGGRDVNRDGKLNIADFGGLGIGFAQRYYPKTSCAL